MGSSGKKKTTMAKLARENRLRERRLNKQARKDAREDARGQVAADRSASLGATSGVGEESSGEPHEQAPPQDRPDEALYAPPNAETEPGDPRAKEAALIRLRNSGDDELAVFEGRLRDGALDAGATEQEIREAQRHHPGHGG